MSSPNSILPSILEENDDYPGAHDQNLSYQTEFDPLIVSLIEEKDRLQDTIAQLTADQKSSLKQIEKLSATVEQLRGELSKKCGGDSSLVTECVALRVDKACLERERDYFRAERRNMRVVLDHIEAYLYSDKSPKRKSSELVGAMKTLFNPRGDSPGGELREKLAEERVRCLEQEVEALNHEVFSLREAMLVEGDSREQQLRSELDQSRMIGALLQKRCRNLSDRLLAVERASQQERECLYSDGSHDASQPKDYSTPPKHPNFSFHDSTHQGNSVQLSFNRIRTAIAERTPLNKWSSDLVLLWLQHWVGFPRSLLFPLHPVHLDSLSDHFSNSFYRLKLLCALSELKDHISSPIIPSESLNGMLNHNWVGDFWLRYVGLPQYVYTFRHNLIDGRMLSLLLHDSNLFKGLSVNSELHKRSFHFSILIFQKIGYSRTRLEEFSSTPFKQISPVFWSASFVTSWLRSQGFDSHVHLLSQKGVNGALITQDIKFSSEDLRRILQIEANSTLADKLAKCLNQLRNGKCDA